MMWGEAVAQLRRLAVGTGEWTMSSPDGRPLLTHRRLGAELTISAGNKHTGNPPKMANFNDARGSGTERATAH